MTKGIILAGGSGTRLLPLTKTTNKHLLPVFNKPMVLYPLATLKRMGINDILIVTGGNHLGSFADLLGDGSEYGVSLTYKVQKEAGGIAQALLLAENFVGDDKFAVILGDNIFSTDIKVPTQDAAIVLKRVANPRRFGVWDESERRIVEKPSDPPSDKAVLGLYFYNKKVFEFIKTLKPSDRGELEITDVNNWYLENDNVDIIEYDGFWSDAGTFESMQAAANFLSSSY